MKEEKLKRQQEYVYQLEKKVSALNGDYYPDLERKKAEMLKNEVKESRVNEDRYVPTKEEFEEIDKELAGYKNRHYEYKKKMEHWTKLKSIVKAAKNEATNNVKAKEKLIDELRSKRDVLYKVVKNYEEELEKQKN